MKCMYCGFLESKVIDSRLSSDGSTIRRRRECLNCGKRFTTYEVVEHTPLLVIKNDGTREPFDVNKIKNGIIKSCEKRPVAMKDIDALAAEIEKKASGKEMEEADVLRILNHTLKELSDEREMYQKGGKDEEVASCDAQIAIVTAYLPTLMG